MFLTNIYKNRNIQRNFSIKYSSNIININLNYINYNNSIRYLSINQDDLSYYDKIIKKIKIAVLTYQNINNNKNYNNDEKISIPKKFIIPIDDNWPKVLWGFKLGKEIKNINQRDSLKQYKYELENIGLDLNDYSKKFNIKDILKAIEIYKINNNINGLLLIPKSFIIPDNNNWPNELKGLELGKIVNNIYKYRSRMKQPKLELEKILGIEFRKHKLGFEYNLSKKTKYLNVCKAIEVYKNINNINGNFCIPSAFIVPNNDNNWPEETWNLKLGLISDKIKNHSLFKEYEIELNQLGFKKNNNKFHYIILALRTYKKNYNINGLFFISPTFVVPHNDLDWPEEIWGLKLGVITKNIRNKNIWKEHRIELENMGFDYDPKRSYFELIKNSLMIYKRINNINYNEYFRIPKIFIVPKEETYPIAAWGMKLGNIALHIRKHRSWYKYHTELKEIGFDFELGNHIK